MVEEKAMCTEIIKVTAIRVLKYVISIQAVVDTFQSDGVAVSARARQSFACGTGSNRHMICPIQDGTAIIAMVTSLLCAKVMPKMVHRFSGAE